MAKRRKQNKSQAIRNYLANNPDATPSTIKAALAAKGITATDSLISQVKYRKTPKANGRKHARPGQSAPSVSMDNLLAARDLAKRLGGLARAKEAISMLEKLL